MIDEWKNKAWYIYTMEHYLATKNEILCFAIILMDLDGIIGSEISWTKKTNTVWSHLYMESEKNKTKWKDSDTESKCCWQKKGSWECGAK